MPREAVGGWQAVFSIQLTAAFISFKRWLRVNHFSCYQRKFTPARLGMSRLQDCPEIKAKAHNCLLLTTWISEIAVRVAMDSDGDAYKRNRALCLWGLNDFFLW